MKYLSIFRIFFLVLVTAFGFSAVSNMYPNTAIQNASAAGGQAYFVDLLYLQEGKTPEDAQVYFDKVEPIIARHGLERIAPGFVITSVMAGEASPELVNVWTVSDPQHTFANIFADPAYLENVPLRNSLFDMARSHMFMMRAAGH